MPQRALWASVLVAAALADAANESRLGFYLVFAGVVGGAAVALRTVADLVDEEGPVLAARAVLTGCALVLVVTAAAVRAPYSTEGVVPQAATTALLAALALVVLDAALAPLRRLEPEPGALLER